MQPRKSIRTCTSTSATNSLIRTWTKGLLSFKSNWIDMLVILTLMPSIYSVNSGQYVETQADLILGTDGAYSAVRKQYMKRPRFNYSQVTTVWFSREVELTGVMFRSTFQPFTWNYAFLQLHQETLVLLLHSLRSNELERLNCSLPWIQLAFTFGRGDTS